MKALTLWQPWASLVALGVKRIETRSWPTTYRGPLLIHAAASVPAALGLGRRGRMTLGEYEVEKDAAGLLLRGPIAWPYRMPLGAVVAVADLVDVVPMSDTEDPPDDCMYVTIDGRGLYRQQVTGDPWVASNVVTSDLTDQLPYGDFSLGRYGWVFDNIRALPEPIPAKGRQGLWTPDDALIAALADSQREAAQ